MKRIIPTDWQTQVKIFEEFGCTFRRQKGDHLIYHHSQAKRAVVIPKYEEIGVAIIKSNMRTVGMSREEYLKLLEKVR
ncbi:type II toxin-antitoxin system HicA family toxin [Dehalococcoidia bacterium]|nr:type II toxin-antitoxin system HicA family toxin [Dehalococcoidia bacterium]MCL0097849.1 type II toxin-antitoxin system HicA family toxin [Dehalococcoidia bacterium]